MELGKVLDIKLKSNTETTWLLSGFRSVAFNKKNAYDTICFEKMFDIWYGKGDKSKPYTRAYWGEKAFNVSLYLRNYDYKEESEFSHITMTSLKQNYNEALHIDDKTSNPLIKEVLKGVRSNLDMEVEETRDIEFEKTIHIKGQGLYKRSEGFGRTSTYSLVGMKLWRWY